MERFVLILSLIILMASCKPRGELSINPLSPNISASVNDLKDWDFEMRSIDDGVCVFERELDDRLMYFYLDQHCKNVVGQGIIFYLDSIQTFSDDYFIKENDSTIIEMYLKTKLEFIRDSLMVTKILGELGGGKMGNSKRWGVSGEIGFSVKNFSNEKEFNCRYSAYPHAVKTLSFESHWR